jgi:hypothetical protein
MNKMIYINKPSPKKAYKSGCFCVSAADRCFAKLLFDRKTGVGTVD